jgi:hypothetical protein
MRHLPFVTLCACAPLPLTAAELIFVANGEALALEGFQDPELTADGWALTFDRVLVNLIEVTAWQTDPPFAADGPVIVGTALSLPAPEFVNLLDVDDSGTVALGAVAAAAGHYNALSFTMAPATDGEFAGLSLVLDGTAHKDGRSVPFTLVAADTIAHACGEYVGDVRLGFVTDSTSALVELTFHLDHLFGRADLPADDPMNVKALGFDRFGTGGLHEFTLGGLHLGHVGEGHCHATAG